MCCTRLDGNTGRENDAKNRHLRTVAQIYRAVSSQLRHISAIGKNLLNSNMSSTCLHNMTNFGLRDAEIGSVVRGTSANFNGFRVLPSLLQRRRSPKANHTLHDVWPSPGMVHYIYIFGGSCPQTEFCPVQNSLYFRPKFAYIGSVTARHSSSGRQPNFVASYKERNYGTLAEGTTYIRQGGHHVGHRPTF